MIQARTNRSPNAMGSFVPLLGAGYAAPATRYCACGTRMSRYAGMSETRCAPCEARINPWQPPEPRPLPDDVCPQCGGYKRASSMRCRKCREGDPLSGTRRQCECGRLARRGRRRCSHCDRERGAA